MLFTVTIMFSKEIKSVKTNLGKDMYMVTITYKEEPDGLIKNELTYKNEIKISERKYYMDNIGYIESEIAIYQDGRVFKVVINYLKNHPKYALNEEQYYNYDLKEITREITYRENSENLISLTRKENLNNIIIFEKYIYKNRYDGKISEILFYNNSKN